jgi:hypothetical protein
VIIKFTVYITYPTVIKLLLLPLTSSEIEEPGLAEIDILNASGDDMISFLQERLRWGDRSEQLV